MVRKKTRLRDLFIIILLLVVIVSLSRMIWSNLEGLRRVRELRRSTALLEEQNRELRSEVERKQDLGYVEEQARRLLGMVKEGERVFIYPSSEGDYTQSSSVEDYGDLKNWQEWLHAFGW